MKIIFGISLFSLLIAHVRLFEDCDLRKYEETLQFSNCSREEFLPLCHATRTCQHESLETLSAGYLDSKSNETITCSFPRIHVGKPGFVKCENFSTHYPCPANATAAWLRSSVCNNNTCDDCDLRKDFGIIGSGPGFKCQSKNEDRLYCVLPQVLLYDDVADCLNGEDLCFNSGSYNDLDDTCHRCPDGTIVPASALCNGVFDCPDLSDECLCTGNRPPICEAIVTDIRSSAPCKFGQVLCHDGKCIDRNEVCNGNIDCDDGIDERNEECGVTLKCDEDKSQKETEENLSKCSIKVETKNRTGPCWKNFLSVARNPDPSLIKCNQVKGHQFISVNAKKCNGIVECEINLEDEMDCPGRFLCPGFDNQTISIPSKKVCDFRVDCGGAEDELNCTDQRFYCRSGDNITFVEMKRVRNGQKDCEDGSDECHITTNSTNSYFFHSRTRLIENQILYLLVWFMASISLIGNLAVICRQVSTLLKLRRRINDLASLKANHILVLNLAVADFLMGVYLLAVGISYENLKESYCKEELVWRGSRACTWMGVLALISSQMSVVTLILLSICRLYASLQPFKTSSKPKKSTIWFFIVCSWALVILAAILPLTDVFRSVAPDTVLLADNPFVKDPVVNFAVGKKYLLESLIYIPFQNQSTLNSFVKQIRSAGTWNDLADINRNLPEERELLIFARYGYYNVHSICLADLFLRWDNPYSTFSLTLVIFDFIAFLCVAAVYISMYFLTFKKIRNGSERSESVNMKSKIARIIASNFATWIPVCLLSFLSFSGEFEINGEVYQVAAIVFLPINSSLNPVLYSNVLSTMLRKICGYADNFKKRTIHLTSVDTTLSTGRSTLDRLKH